MNVLIALASAAALALVAAAGVAAGYRRRDPVPVDAPTDPLEDRRLALLRSLADLEEAHTSGALEDPAYGRLREDTEGRMARVLHAIDARSTKQTPVAAAAAATARAPGRVPPWAVGTLLAATVGAVLVVGLLRDAEPVRVAATPASEQDPFAFFEERVRDHPDDVAARLDLAQRYLDAGRAEDALAEYGAALELDPDDAEALAHVGLILLQSGQPEAALASVDRALETAPEYPEALFFRGVILLEGMGMPEEAIDALERYLAAAPFGSERDLAEELIAQAEAALAAR
ncbi:MAG: tetratricopeptide repeat protein [Actinomycetota bacterium]